jgi:hypothetical protein
VLEPGQDARLAALAAADDGAESLAVAGGDGSTAAVAGVAAERGLPLVVVPTGTLNHFARDLGLDLTRPLSALDAFYADHEERRVDVGRINGRLFINNVGYSLKFAPTPLWWHHALRRKAQNQLRLGGRKGRGTMHKMRRARAPEQRAPEQPPFGSQVAFARLATALAVSGLGAVAIGALAIRRLLVKRARIERLEIEELEVGRLHVRELVVDQEQSSRQEA